MALDLLGRASLTKVLKSPLLPILPTVSFPQAGVGDYVNGFSLVLGVYMLGLQGVLLGPALVCLGKLLYELGGSIIHEAEGLVTPVNDVHMHESLPPHQQRQQHRRGGPRARAGECETLGRSPLARTAASDRITNEARRDSKQRLEKWSNDFEYRVSQTMRRLSFLSPFCADPSASSVLARPAAPSGNTFDLLVTPRMVSTLKEKLKGNYLIDQSLDSATADSNEHSRPTNIIHSHSSECSMGFSADTWAVVGVEGGESVRVVVPAGSAWPDFLDAVSARMRSCGVLPTAHLDFVRVIALRDVHGNLVASVDDLRCGERLVAVTSDCHANDGSQGKECICSMACLPTCEGESLSSDCRGASCSAADDTSPQETAQQHGRFSGLCATREAQTGPLSLPPTVPQTPPPLRDEGLRRLIQSVR